MHAYCHVTKVEACQFNDLPTVPAIKKLPFAFRIEPFEQHLRSGLHPFRCVPFRTSTCIIISVVGVHYDNTLINAQAAWYTYMERSIGTVLNAID